MSHAWDALDRDLGTLQRITPETIVAASRLIKTGETVNLSLPVTEPDPPLFGRQPLRHEILQISRNDMDDRLDCFYPQGSSQWDGLRHVRAREFGYFGGFDEELEPGAGPLGIEHWAERGIFGRGVLLDIVGLRAEQGRDFDPLGGETIVVSDLEAAVRRQGIEIGAGDILCLRTGWIDAFRELPSGDREHLAQTPRISGLEGSEEMARWLWDAGIAAVAADNPTLEVAPGDPAVGSLHRRLIPLLGFVIGELFDLAPLTRLCAAEGRWDFFFAAVPLNLPGGVGSPANAMAIR